MVELSRVKQGEKVADLGSGDGRISLAFAKIGGIVTGYELDKDLVQSSERAIKDAQVQSLVVIKNENFWDADLSKFEIVCIYPMPDIMEQLEEKLTNELKKGARVLTNYYLFPTWKPKMVKDNIYLFEK